MSVAHRLAVMSLFAVVATAGVVIAHLPPAYGAATIVVNTLADEDVDNAACSLREAIIAANTNASYHGCAALGAGVNDEIMFDLGSGTPTITVGATALPAITEWVTIDGGSGRVELHGPGGPLVSGRHGLMVAHEGFGTTIRNLVINNFADDGIYIDADEVSVFGCFLGTDATGTMPMPNQGFGVQVFGGNGVRIGGATSGGPCAGDCNLISAAKLGKADVLLDLNSTGALVRGNFIGTDVTGTVAVGSSTTQGVADKGTSNRIGGVAGITPGGPCTGDCNVISGNNSDSGVFIDKAATGSVVQGNFIGPDVTGNDAVSSDFAVGVRVNATGALIGGTAAEARNIVSGNLGVNIQIGGANTSVEGNYVGPNSAGTAAVLVNGTGIYVMQANGATIGSGDSGAGNLISGAATVAGYGIKIEQSTNVAVLGNLIGLAADGTSPLPNLLDGVFIFNQSSDNVIGAFNVGNVIAFNGRNGIYINGGAPAVHHNTIRDNSIYSNGAAGIALIANGNDNLPPPTIDGVEPLHGTACAPCQVDFYSDSEDEGRRFEASIFTNDGFWTLDFSLGGPHITATNTDQSGNTSAFSAPAALPTDTPTESPTPLPSPTIATFTTTATRTSIPAPTHTRTVGSSPTATATANSNATGTSTTVPTNTPTPPTTLTATAIVSSSPTPTGTVAPCIGDCNDDGAVSIDELITGVNIALGAVPVSACPPFGNAAGMVDIARLIAGVNSALNGCAAVPL